MTDAQMRSDMEALMTRVVHTERALMDTRQQVAAVPKVAAPLVDTRTIGKAPTFTGEHKEWPEWSYQFTAYMESANRVVRSTMLNCTWPWHCCAREARW